MIVRTNLVFNILIAVFVGIALVAPAPVAPVPEIVGVIRLVLGIGVLRTAGLAVDGRRWGKRYGITLRHEVRRYCRMERVAALSQDVPVGGRRVRVRG